MLLTTLVRIGVCIHAQKSYRDLLAGCCARAVNGEDTISGVFFSADAFLYTNNKLIIDLAMRHRLPAIYGSPGTAADGGLLYYCVDIVDLSRKAAAYGDRILRGEKPSDLPVQQPTKFDTTINLETAKALGLTVPNTLLVSADEVI